MTATDEHSSMQGAARAPATLLRLKSRFDHAATLGRFREALQGRGVQIFAEIDQAGAASEAGFRMRPTTLFVFGNPKAGTPVMEAYPYAAVELPLRVVVSDEGAAGVFLYYQDVAEVLSRDYGVGESLLEPLRSTGKLMRFIVGEG
jgi:uncharacterized protein (DUF302 family)